MRIGFVSQLNDSNNRFSSKVQAVLWNRTCNLATFAELLREIIQGGKSPTKLLTKFMQRKKRTIQQSETDKLGASLFVPLQTGRAYSFLVFAQIQRSWPWNFIFLFTFPEFHDNWGETLPLNRYSDLLPSLQVALANAPADMQLYIHSCCVTTKQI